MWIRLHISKLQFDGYFGEKISMQLPSQKKVSTKSLQCKNCTTELDFPKTYYAKLELNSVPSEH